MKKSVQMLLLAVWGMTLINTACTSNNAAQAENQPVAGKTATAAASSPMVKKLDVTGAKALVGAPPAGLQIIDLRTTEEAQATGIIAGARLMDITDPGFAGKLATLDAKSPVLLYCAAGGRSARGIQVFKEKGFNTIYEMSPGMNGWLNAGAPTEKFK